MLAAYIFKMCREEFLDLMAFESTDAHNVASPKRLTVRGMKVSCGASEGFNVPRCDAVYIDV